MNKVHKDGRALLKLSRELELELAPDKDLSRKNNPDSKPAPTDGIQRQDTDYDVTPEIPTPEPSGRKSKDQHKQKKSGREGAERRARMAISSWMKSALKDADRKPLNGG